MRKNSWTLCKAIEKLTCLESLNISVDYTSNNPLDLNHVTSPPLRLQRLYLIGPLEKFPNWIGRLENLKKLRFRGSKLNDIPLDFLRDLPNLKMLGINEGVYYGERLVFHVGGFKMLKPMYLDSLRYLKSIEIQPGALPFLEDLVIRRSPQLKQVPVGLHCLTRLACLKVVEMPEDFVGSISSNQDIVKHVKDIRVGYQTSKGHYIFKNFDVMPITCNQSNVCSNAASQSA
ncbi:Disease resistance protein RPM1 [Bienertia sinuspersici]